MVLLRTLASAQPVDKKGGEEGRGEGWGAGGWEGLSGVGGAAKVPGR